MKLLGNIIWFVFGGVLIAIEYFIASFCCALPLLEFPLEYKRLNLVYWRFGPLAKP